MIYETVISKNNGYDADIEEYQNETNDYFQVKCESHIGNATLKFDRQLSDSEIELVKSLTLKYNSFTIEESNTRIKQEVKSLGCISFFIQIERFEGE